MLFSPIFPRLLRKRRHWRSLSPAARLRSPSSASGGESESDNPRVLNEVSTPSRPRVDRAALSDDSRSVIGHGTTMACSMRTAHCWGDAVAASDEWRAASACSGFWHADHARPLLDCSGRSPGSCARLFRSDEQCCHQSHGRIAEALIATACGWASRFCRCPYNFFNRQLVITLAA